MGKQVAEYYQKVAIEDCNGYKKELQEARKELIDRLKKEGRQRDIEKELTLLKENFPKVEKIPNDLCYLVGEHREDYLHDMRICQEYASENRRVILKTILRNFIGNYEAENVIKTDSFETIHNYIDFRDNIVRKGAISCKKGEKVLIPMNMRDGCIVAVGKGNDEWNCSGPHGAGRLMSRSKAKESISMDDYQNSMKDIYTTSVCESTIDESPMVYKPIEEILNYIKDTVDVISILKPVYNFKAK